MGRADIAILSEISFGIRLCLHPPHYLRWGGRRMMAWPFCGRPSCIVATRRTCRVERRPRPSHWPQISLRASVVTGSYGLIVPLFLTDKNHNPDVDRPALWQDCP